MANQTPQTYANHTRFDPIYHFFALPVFAITFLLTIWSLSQNLAQNIFQGPFGFSTVLAVWTVLLALAVVVAAYKLRVYALKAQDRVIRLEERLRLSLVLSEPLRARIGELTEAQLIALRFASDSELPSLAEKALAEKLSPAEIKKAIVIWRPDYFRV